MKSHQGKQNKTPSHKLKVWIGHCQQTNKQKKWWVYIVQILHWTIPQLNLSQIDMSKNCYIIKILFDVKYMKELIFELGL